VAASIVGCAAEDCNLEIDQYNNVVRSAHFFLAGANAWPSLRGEDGMIQRYHLGKLWI
jgi:hypothetical protein